MKKVTLLIALAVSTLNFSCKKEDKETDKVEVKIEETTSPATTSSSNNQTAVQGEAVKNTPKVYDITATPETYILGKKDQAEIKIVNVKALQLSDPDGNDTGMELTYVMEVVNKNPIKGGTIYVNAADFRLELDNGNKISPNDNVALRVKEEETKISQQLMFKLPAGTKPAVLHLFFEETRGVVKLEMK